MISKWQPPWRDEKLVILSQKIAVKTCKKALAEFATKLSDLVAFLQQTSNLISQWLPCPSLWVEILLNHVKFTNTAIANF